MKKLILSLYLILATCALFGQSFIPFKMEEYASHLPLEKIYAQTNKTIFIPDETIFFSAYITNENFIISYKSRTLKAEFINPAGQTIETKYFTINNLSSKGSFKIKPDAVGGQYKLRISTAWSDNFTNQSYEKEITVLRNIAPRILMKLDIEKEAYGKNDTVRGFLHIRDLNNVDISYLPFEYEVKIDGNTFIKKEAKTNKNGKDTITFILPNYITDQHTSLNVVFNYNLYQESITRNVPIITDDIDLQFLPEGGFMLTGFANNVAFKAINQEGNPADIKGKIYNDKGKFITSFESFHQGMGKVSITPLQGEKYYAIISSPYQSSQKFDIPESKSEGFPINIIEHKDAELIFNILSNQDADVNILIRTEQNIKLNKNIKLKKGLNRQVINTKNLPLGVLSICVTTADQIISERLFFNQNEQGLTININPDKESYRSRETTKLQIKTLNNEGKPIPAIISLSVIDDKLLSYVDDKQHNMLSWMLLGSSINGTIYEPSFYFDPSQNKRLKAMDMLLLTQGWRNYNWDNILSKAPIVIKHTDTQNIISGEVKNFSNQPYQTTVYIIADSLLYTVKTDKNGYFEAQTIPTKQWYVFIPKTKGNDNIYILHAKLQENSKYNTFQRVEIDVKADIPNTNFPNQEEVEEDKKETTSSTNSYSSVKSSRNNSSISNDGQLNEVEIMGYSVLKKNLMTSAVTTIVANQLYTIPTSDLAAALSGKVVGLEVNSIPKDRSSLSIRGISRVQSTNGPLIVLDGIPLNEAASFNLESLNLNSVNKVTVIQNAEATALYGARGANGVIIIKTNNAITAEDRYRYDSYANNRVIGPNKLLKSTIFYNYSQQFVNQADEFYFPKYESRKKTLKNDFRDNLYWNYHIETDQEGKATVSYSNGDENSLYRIIAEGITGNGQIGRSESSTYAVHDDLSLDVKLPLYASQDDIIDLPIWINNSTNHNVDANLKINLSGGMHLEGKDNLIKISNNDKVLKLIPIRVKSTFDKTENIRLLLESQDDKIGMIKDIKLFSKGFPIEFGRSTNKSLSHAFEINNVIGIQELKIDLYLSPIQQITDGLSRIIREPYGCFEQVSSAVYPNIYALQLLRQTGGNKNLEQKSLEYLKNGYNKLKAYEIKDGGFDWYGKPPAHEVLSAFGLIEFIEMKPYIDVNSAMIERTKQWLLSKKNNKGGYHQGTGRYAFAGKRNIINNSYITYALSIAGCREEIENEYQTAKKEALLSKDLYRLSLVALTAKELKKEEDYRLIYAILKDKLADLITYNTTKKLVEGSITQSNGNSLYNETLALMALAFMKEENISDALTLTINKLITNSNSGYFGSTQATGLALKAISNYYLLINKKISKSNPQISFKIDGVEYLKDTIKKNESLSWVLFPNLQAGKHQIEMSLEGIEFGILSFTYKYKTTLPPNSADRSLDMHSSLSHDQVKVGDNTLLNVKVKNKKSEAVPMSIVKIGLPGGASPEPKQLRDLLESGLIDFYEVFNNYLVLYWREIGPNEEKSISIDLKAQVPGDYTGAASSTYLYYTEELKHWNEGLHVRITQ